MSDLGTGLYLYCLARPDLAVAPQGPSVDGRSPLVLHRFAAAAAVVSQVSLSEFCGPEAEHNFRQLAWIGPRACRHEQIVEETMRGSPVLPAGFGTIFSSVARLERFVVRHGPAIRDFLERVAGQEEWAVTGMLDRARAIDAACAAALATQRLDPSESRPGRRHLEEQRLRAETARTLHHGLSRIGRALAEDFQRHAAAFVEREVRSANDGGNREVIFNWAFLVCREKAQTMQALARRANAEHAGGGLSFRISGPWPPYSFSPALSMETDQ